MPRLPPQRQGIWSLPRSLGNLCLFPWLLLAVAWSEGWGEGGHHPERGAWPTGPHTTAHQSPQSNLEALAACTSRACGLSTPTGSPPPHLTRLGRKPSPRYPKLSGGQFSTQFVMPLGSVCSAGGAGGSGGFALCTASHIIPVFPAAHPLPVLRFCREVAVCAPASSVGGEGGP